MLISLGLAAWVAADEIQLVGITSADDVDKAEALRNAVTPKITSIHHFLRNSMSRPDIAPIFVHPGTAFAILKQPPTIIVYEIKDRGEQDKVIVAVQAAVRGQKLRRVDLQFMDHENWITGENAAASWGKRGPELQLRRVRILQGHVQEDGGEKTITYHF
jgi:hypothetical protein